MRSEKAKEIIRRRDDLAKEKRLFTQHWEDLARVMLPRAMGFQGEPIEGESRTEQIFDGTPMQACRTLGHHMGFWLRPDSSEWYFIKAADEGLRQQEQAKIWLDDTKKRLDGALNNPKARFRQSTGEVDLFLVVFGTGILFIGEGVNMSHLLFQSIHLKDCVLVYNEDGNLDGLILTKKMTVRQAYARWGEKLSEELLKLYRENKLDVRKDFIRAVMPRTEKFFEAPKLARNLPIADMWIEVDEEHIIEEGGFHELPFVAPRWDTTSGEDYGRSPGMIALPDSNTLQAMGETILVSGQRAADPPLMAPNDGAFNELATFPGAVSYYDVEIARELGGNPIFSMESGVNLPITRDMQLDTREQVVRAFFKNVLNLPVDGPQMTATEVMQRKEEFIREIGPVFGRFETDYTAPMIQRAFMIMLRAGSFAPIPPILQGQGITFEFESPVNKVKQQIRAAAAKQWVAEQLELGQMIPTAIDHINVDGYSKVTHDADGVPNEVKNTEEIIMQIRQQRAEQAKREQEMLQLERSTEVAAGMANTADTLGITQEIREKAKANNPVPTKKAS
mgnify:FL=1